MRRTFTYTELATTAIFVCFLFSVNLYVYASDVPHIAFSSNRSGNYDIYMMDINGKNLQQLTDHPANERSPAFSPDGQRMAYISTRDGNLDIYVMSLPTKVSHRLTDHPGHDDNPAWSPDGRWIAFDSNRAGMYDIYKIGLSGENLQRLTHEGNNYNPAWSPDGKTDRFLIQKGGIHMMDSGGADPRRLANQPRSGKTPSWSPDGKQIAFSDMILGGNWDIYTLNVDGSNLRRMTRHLSKDMFSGFGVLMVDQLFFYSRWNEKIRHLSYKRRGLATCHPIDGASGGRPVSDVGACGLFLRFSNCWDANNTLGQVEAICSGLNEELFFNVTIWYFLCCNSKTRNSTEPFEENFLLTEWFYRPSVHFRLS